MAANKSVTDAQNNVNAKQQALADAKKALKDLQDQVAKDQASGAAGFFKSIADNKDNSDSLREDARTAYDIVTGTYYNEPSWYAEKVHLGAKDDATSIEEMKNVLPYLSTVNAARTSHNRSILGISLVDMAVAMIDADYQTNGLDHPQSLYGSENLTTDLENPVQSWMNEELVWNEMLKEHPEYANVLNFGQEGIYDFFVGHTNDYEEVGHFLNLMNSDLTTFGMGRLDDTAVSWDAGSIMVGTENPLSVEDYANAFNKYSKDVLKEDQINTLKANVETANQNLIDAQNAVQTAQNNVKNLQANLAELNNGSTKINKAIADTQAALAKGQENLEFEQKQLDQANKNLADVQAKVGAKAKALDDAKAGQAKADAALTQAQNVLAEASAAVKAAQSTVDSAKNNADAKNKDLKAAQASLESLNQALSNLENAKANLAAAQSALTAANDDVLTADKDVKAQQLILTSLEEAKGKSDAQVASAEKELKKAESDLATEQSKLEDAKAKLDELNKKANNAGKSDPKSENNNQKPAKPAAKPGSETPNTEKPTTKPETNAQGSDEPAVKPEPNTPSSNESGSKKEQDTETEKPEMKNEPKSNKTKEEAKSSSSVKIVDNADSSTASVVLAGSNTAVKVYGEKTVNGTTYYKVEANRWVKADKAHVVSIGDQATTKHLPQTGAKNEIIAAISGLTVASVCIASAMGMSRKKKNN